MTSTTVSVVIAAHNEAEALPLLLPDVLETLEGCDVEAVVLVVDDGSTDATARVVLEARDTDPRIQLLQLSRNFGHQAALMAGLSAVAGEAVICMDGDGQHPAHVLRDLVEQWKAGTDVVNTIRVDSPDVGRTKRLGARMFYRMFRLLTGLELRDGMADFRLLSRRALDATLAAVGNRPFFRGAAVWVGFPQAAVPYEARDRTMGKSSYSLKNMARLARDGIIGFSIRPLWILASVGLLSSLLAFLIALYATVVGLVIDRTVPGWASTVVFTAVLQGLVFVLLGVFGLYIGAIFAEVLGRPTFIVAAMHDDPSPPKGHAHELPPGYEP